MMTKVIQCMVYPVIRLEVTDMEIVIKLFILEA